MSLLLITTFVGAGIAATLGLLIGALLTIAARQLSVEKDQLLSEIDDLLPGLNCGSCGYAGCVTYAEALARKTIDDLTLCKPGGAGLPTDLAKALGMDIPTDTAEPEVAFIRCGGIARAAKRDFDYSGIRDCAAAALFFGGEKSCKEGCLGFGSCAAACPVDAIVIQEDRLAVVNEELCIGCNQCISICPTRVIAMVPTNSVYRVRCAAHSALKETRANCKKGCIGCSICAKKYDHLHFKVSDNLAEVDYKQTNDQFNRGDLTEIIKKCPAGCIMEKS